LQDAGSEAGARLAIRLLQESVERGELDPWDIDVIAVVDGFLDRLQQRLQQPVRPQARGLAAVGSGGSYERDLADTSEAFLAAAVLVSLKAEVLEAETLQADAGDPECDLPIEEEPLWAPSRTLPARPERHLLRRPVAPPPLQRTVSLGELIQHLEDIAERLEQDGQRSRQTRRPRRYSQRAAIAQVAALAHREKLPETTVALRGFLHEGYPIEHWVDFEELVRTWEEAAPADLDRDRVGVFWALLFLCSQGSVALAQEGSLHGPLRLQRLAPQEQERLGPRRLHGEEPPRQATAIAA
jgi:segregation and condensation protein A